MRFVAQAYEPADRLAARSVGHAEASLDAGRSDPALRRLFIWQLPSPQQLEAVNNDPAASADRIYPAATLEGLEDPAEAPFLVVTARFDQAPVDLAGRHRASVRAEYLYDSIRVAQLSEGCRGWPAASQIGELDT